MLRQPNLLHDYLINAAAQYPEKEALVFDQQRFTYKEINRITDNIAQNLLQLGLKKGARVVTCMGNCVETVLTFWAVLKAGGVISVISDDLPQDKIVYIINDSGCQFYVAKNALNDHRYVSFDDISLQQSCVIPVENNLDIDLAAIIYTSGSTGEPKGVMLTHRNMLAASQSINTYLNNTDTDVFLSALPLSFDYGLYQMIMAFSVGAKLVLEKDFLLPIRYIRKISEEKVTALPGVPTLFSILGETFKKYPFDTSSVRYVTNTGAAIYDHHVDIIRSVFSGTQFYSMYGLTECKRCTYLPPEDLDRKRGSVGIAIPNTEIWVVDDEGKPLGPHQVGQLVIRGATVMKGYWNRPDETARKLKCGKLPGESVLHTGDYGYLDEEGYFYFKGRMDEAIKSRGVKVTPKEIEEVLHSIDGVKEAAVIGVPDPVLDFEIVAYVACFSEAKLQEIDIYQACKKSIEKSKLPHRIIMVTHLPKTTNGKVNKLLLSETTRKVAELVEQVHA